MPRKKKKVEASPLAFGATDVDLVTGADTSPHVTQSETFTTANPDNPLQVIVAYNDSRGRQQQLLRCIGLDGWRHHVHSSHFFFLASFLRPAAGTEPVARIVAVLALSVGFPYLLLAATGPLLQRWYARRDGAAFPYRLFAISNAGSLAALMLYPFAIEPVISVRQQLFAWSVAYAAVAGSARAWRLS